VHDLPDFVYFDHSVHIGKGIGCESCHGRIDKMPLTARAQTLNMEWCLECHRDPVPNLRPKDAVVEMGWKDRWMAEKRADVWPEGHPDAGHPKKDDLEIARELLETQHEWARERDVKSLTNCSICHR
jgi:hypothetical protein